MAMRRRQTCAGRAAGERRGTAVADKNAMVICQIGLFETLCASVKSELMMRSIESLEVDQDVENWFLDFGQVALAF